MFKRNIIRVAIVLAILLLVVSTVGYVRPGNVGVLTTFGAVSNNVKRAGIYVKIPFVQSVKQIDVRTKKMEWSKTEDAISVMSKDLLDVYVQVTVAYHLIPDRTANIYKSIGSDFTEIILKPLTLNTIRNHIAKYNAVDISSNVEKIANEVNIDLSEKFYKYDMNLELVSITNIDFRPEFKEALTQKQINEKQLEMQRIVSEKQDLESQQKIKKAEADKKIKILEAEADEEYNKKLSASLSDNLIKYKVLESQQKAIEKWNGSYPQVVAGEQSIPLIQLPQSNEPTK